MPQPFVGLRRQRGLAPRQPQHHAIKHHLGQFGEGQIKQQKRPKIPHPPIVMGIVGKARGFGAAQFARPIHDIFDPK